ncbi:MAG: hypothetical protein AB8B61_00525 [Cyclobacteriaceae bacterium]
MWWGCGLLFKRLTCVFHENNFEIGLEKNLQITENWRGRLVWYVDFKVANITGIKTPSRMHRNIPLVAFLYTSSVLHHLDIDHKREGS